MNHLTEAGRRARQQQNDVRDLADQRLMIADAGLWRCEACGGWRYSVQPCGTCTLGFAALERPVAS
ncbi:hypothetical protein [Angustibacter luteus]|uniref:Uncharacterized protein n=1 Tax=Angustibacter luteus TaxID=658456 RepID=A0ABW1JJW8_9ACTN